MSGDKWAVMAFLECGAVHREARSKKGSAGLIKELASRRCCFVSVSAVEIFRDFYTRLFPAKKKSISGLFF